MSDTRHRLSFAISIMWSLKVKKSVAFELTIIIHCVYPTVSNNSVRPLGRVAVGKKQHQKIPSVRISNSN